MNRKHFYIGMSIVLLITVIGLIGWSLFIARQQEELNKQATVGVFSSQNRNTPFGGTLSGVANTVADLLRGDNDNLSVRKNISVQEHYNLPSSGVTLYATSSIRFVDRATGHVFEYSRDSGETTRIEQTTIPQVYEALFVQGGEGVIRRFIDENNTIITTYTNLAPSENENASLIYLPDNLRSVAVSPDGAYLAGVRSTQEGSEVITLRVDGGEKEQWFTSTLRGLNIQWVAKTLVVTQAPSAKVHGSVITISLPHKTVTTHIRQRPGLETRMSPDGNLLLFSVVDDKDLPALSLYDMREGIERPLYVRGIASKCTWSVDSTRFWCALPDKVAPGDFPDAYYQGAIHTSDALWEMDIDSGIFSEVVRFSSFSNIPLDVQHLTTDQTGTLFIFLNGSNQTVWSVELSNEDEVQ